METRALSMKCRFCGTPFGNDSLRDTAQFCSIDHQREYEEAANRIALSPAMARGTADDSKAGFILEEKDFWRDRSLPPKPYPEESYPRVPAVCLPRLESTDGVRSTTSAESLLDQRIEAVSLLGMYEFPIFCLQPVGELKPALRRRRRWENPGRSARPSAHRVPPAEPKRFPSASPKGFTSEMPISKLQPSFRVLRGDVPMARTMSPIQPQQGGPTFQAGPPNPHLTAVRQAALQMAEKRWKTITIPKASIEPLEFRSSIEWTNTTKLNYDASGFNYTGDPEIKKPARVVNDVVINVRTLLEGSESSPAPGARTIQFEPVQWDELDAGVVYADEPVQTLARALELFEPPAKPQAKAGPANEITEAKVIEAKVEEPPFEPPPLCEAEPFGKPAIRRGPAAIVAPPADPLAATGVRVQIPAISIQPLRRPLCTGPRPEPEIKPAPVKEEPKAELAPTTAPVVESKPADEPVTVKPVTELKQPEAKSAPAQSTHGRKKKKQQKQAGRGDQFDPVEEPEELGDEVEAELLAAQQSYDVAPPEASVPVGEPRKPEATQKESKKQESKKAETKAAKPSVTFGGLADTPVKTTESIGLGLSKPESELITPVTGMGMGAKIGIATVLVAVAGGAGAFLFSGGSQQPAQKPVSGVAVSQVQTAGLVMGEAGWSTDYASDDKGRRLRQISFYRPSMQIADYRVEFEAEIEYKAVSWVVRAANTKSHYVVKLVQERGAKGPMIKVQRFPVIENQIGEIADKETTISAAAGSVYRVQMDVVGDKYRVAVNDKTVDRWTFSQLATGGFGVANEGAERGQIRAVQMWHLSERPAK